MYACTFYIEKLGAKLDYAFLTCLLYLNCLCFLALYHISYRIHDMPQHMGNQPGQNNGTSIYLVLLLLKIRDMENLIKETRYA